MRHRRLRVAVVDDEDNVRRALGRFFRAAGYEVSTFGSGGDFLEAIIEEPPDCAVLDLHLTGITGVEVLERLRQAGNRLPVVVVTGRLAPGVTERALAAGASACLRKPLDGDLLVRALTAAVHRAERSSAV
jgi:FixJ family two-component response regulator